MPGNGKLFMKKTAAFLSLLILFMMLGGCRMIKIEEAERTPLKYTVADRSQIPEEAAKLIEEKKEKWLAAIREDQIGVFTHVLNTDENDIVKAYSIQAFPTKILLSPTGEILGRWEGEASELDQMLEKIFLK